jgi:hypothetical protein
MKGKHLSLALAALLAAGGLWFARSAWRTHPLPASSMDAGSKSPHGPTEPGRMPGGDMDMKATQDQPNHRQMLRPPDPSRLFRDFTPEQRVEFARKGHGPGG